jgi:multiple sugar transport system substrate-binding protein
MNKPGHVKMFLTSLVLITMLGGLLAGCGAEATPTPGAGTGATGEATATTAAAPAAGATATTAPAAAEATPTTAAAAEPTTATGGGAAISDQFKGTTLNMVAANHAWNVAIQPLIPEFESASGIKINLTSYGEDQLSNQLTVRFTSGAGDIDMMMFRPLQEGKLFGNNGWLADLTSYTEAAGDWDWNDFQEPARGTVTFDGKAYGVPIVTEREILYYRKDLFQEKNIKVPETLDELMAAAKALHDPNANPPMYGFVARGQRAPAVTQFSGFLYAFGADWVVDGKSGVGTPEAIQAYQFYGDILRNYGAPGVLNMSWPQAIGIFGQGQAAMYTDADSLYPNLLDPSKSVVTDKVGYAMFPSGPAGSHPYNVTSWALGVAESSQNKDAAWEFVKWAASKDVVMRLQKGGLPGARSSVWDSPEGIEGFPPDLAEVINKSAAVGTDHDRPLVVRVGQARDIVGGPIVAAIEGQDVAAAAKQADTEFNAFLETDATAQP